MIGSELHTSHFPYGEYRLARASWRDVFALHRLERLIFPGDAYSYPELLALLVWPGMANLKLVDRHGRLAAFFSGGPFPGGGRTWIMTIGVHPEHQRRGLAWRLLAEGEACLAGPTIYLTVRASNRRAYALYAQNGYIQVRVKARYYPDGEDGIEMRKDRP